MQQVSGPPFRVVAPLAFLDGLAHARLPDVGLVALGRDVLEVLGAQGAPLDAAYPDYERLLCSGTSPMTTVTSDELLRAVMDAEDVVAVRLDGDRVDITPPGPPGTLGFSRSFLLDSVRAARAEHVALALDDRSALSVAAADRPDDVHVLMPIHLHH
ncbi:hypothetical protein [Oerskovia merdavium]|uniref:hypothetical protein n=1 Tax=Oerskovia merdavium TaxID=2762227 RepID=UPI00296B48C7|nr:hypothetical protein [Oerskovia merdavium]